MSAEHIALKVPELPESVADATIMALHHQPGETVQRDALLVELETDKVVLEVPAPKAGVLDRWEVAEGDVVTADAILGYLREADAVPPAAVDPSTRQGGDGDADEFGTAMPTPTPQATQPPPTPTPTAQPVDDSSASPPPPSPAIRRLLNEHDLDPAAIQGTGADGRLTKEDVQAYLAQQTTPDPTRPEPVATPRPAPATTTPTPRSTPEQTQTTTGARHEERVPMSRLRARIAERLLEAKQNTAMLTTFNEVDLSAILHLRQQHKERFAEIHQVKLGFMGFFVMACARALARFPMVNAAIDGQDIIYHHYSDIGIAVSAPRGLVVPILRDAHTLSLAQIEQKIRDFAERARDGKLDLDDLRGGTFTITNGGVFGSLLSTPIINPPQSAILGMHAIQERPVARKGEVVIRPMMYVALSYDHRLIDGADAVRFLVTVKESLEDPQRLLLEI